MLAALRKYLKSVNEVNRHGYLLLLSIVAFVMLLCVIPAFLQMLIILLVILSG